MKTFSRAISTTLGAGVLLTLLVSSANAGCGDVSQVRGPFQMALPAAGIRAVSPGVATAKANGGGSSASIVGMWKIQFISQGNSASTPAIPDGAVVDFGYTQLHSDGTELLNSGAHTPSTQNFCMGVWGQTGFLSYELNHFALSYSSLTGELVNYVNIREQLTLSPSGDMFSGTFTIDIYDTNQNHLGHVTGNVTATRVTVDTTVF
jgi:hypothetical protein